MPESVTPQPEDSEQETGTNSTASSPEMTWREAALKKWATALAKVKLLPQLIAWKSIRGTMDKEAKLHDANARMYHNILHRKFTGKDDPNLKSSEEDEMGDIILGDITVTNTNEPAPQKTPTKKPLGFLAKTAIAAALIGTGAGGVLAWPSIVNMFAPSVETPAPVETSDPKIITQPGTDFDYKILPPKVIQSD